MNVPPASQPTETPAAGAQESARPAATQEALLRSRRVADGATTPILPDCCNLGITVRVLVAMNLAACLLAFATGVASGDPFDRLIEIVLILEPVTLASLVALCALRKSVNGMVLQAQWAVGILVPTLLTLIVCVLTRGMVYAEAEAGRFALWVATRCLAAAAISWLTIEYFRLRALSFSPSLAEARLQALQARIRPHFLFNSLNTVLGLMRGDPRRAEHTLENLSDLFRVFMRDTRELVPLDEEVVTCQQYLAIEQLRLGDRLQVVWRLDDMPADALLPSLLLQPLIENAVHHGIEPRTDPGEITVEITRSGERVRVEILNPVAADQPTKPGNQMALSNVRERLMLLYDMEAELKTSADHGQFRLVLEFPYRKERRRRDVRRHFSPYS
ncbi:MAG TPA: histidine kinase [Quisquiliibacterium sp.]|nr:histidine kinase [Quisquiliibacterium sp.]HQN11534.1 histidine kinase [Quisquiliibacterium sp.]HQP65613.1 histidine kinase [Quisquiliibacterium sp.]